MASLLGIEEEGHQTAGRDWHTTCGMSCDLWRCSFVALLMGLAKLALAQQRRSLLLQVLLAKIVEAAQSVLWTLDPDSDWTTGCDWSEWWLPRRPPRDLEYRNESEEGTSWKWEVCNWLLKEPNQPTDARLSPNCGTISLKESEESPGDEDRSSYCRRPRPLCGLGLGYKWNQKCLFPHKDARFHSIISLSKHRFTHLEVRATYK